MDRNSENVFHYHCVFNDSSVCKFFKGDISYVVCIMYIMLYDDNIIYTIYLYQKKKKFYIQKTI